MRNSLNIKINRFLASYDDELPHLSEQTLYQLRLSPIGICLSMRFHILDHDLSELELDLAVVIRAPVQVFPQAATVVFQLDVARLL